MATKEESAQRSNLSVEVVQKNEDIKFLELMIRAGWKTRYEMFDWGLAVT